MERVRKDFDFSVCGVIGNYLIVKQLREESAEARKIIVTAEHLGTEEVGKAKGILMKNLIAMVNAEKMLDMEIKQVH